MGEPELSQQWPFTSETNAKEENLAQYRERGQNSLSESS